MRKRILILGDALTIAVLTIIGFATHGETDSSYIPRMAVMFFPMLFCWFLLAYLMGLFDAQLALVPANLWRVAVAGVFATPLAVAIRGALLNAAILPVFVFVMLGVNSLGLLIWRGSFILFGGRSSS